MTVGDLIEELRKFDPNITVYCECESRHRDPEPIRVFRFIDCRREEEQEIVEL